MRVDAGCAAPDRGSLPTPTARTTKPTNKTGEVKTKNRDAKLGVPVFYWRYNVGTIVSVKSLSLKPVEHETLQPQLVDVFKSSFSD